VLPFPARCAEARALTPEEEMRSRSQKILRDLGLQEEEDDAKGDESIRAERSEVSGSGGKSSEREHSFRPRYRIIRSALFSAAISLSSKSRVDKVQAAIEGNLYKLGKGVYGPPSLSPGRLLVPRAPSAAPAI